MTMPESGTPLVWALVFIAVFAFVEFLAFAFGGLSVVAKVAELLDLGVQPQLGRGGSQASVFAARPALPLRVHRRRRFPESPRGDELAPSRRSG